MGFFPWSNNPIWPFRYDCSHAPISKTEYAVRRGNPYQRHYIRRPRFGSTRRRDRFVVLDTFSEDPYADYDYPRPHRSPHHRCGPPPPPPRGCCGPPPPHRPRCRASPPSRLYGDMLPPHAPGPRPSFRSYLRGKYRCYDDDDDDFERDCFDCAPSRRRGGRAGSFERVRPPYRFYSDDDDYLGYGGRRVRIETRTPNL